MPLSEPPNPEHKSNNAMLCFCIGAGLAALSWFLGVGSAFSAAFAGGLASAAVGVVGGVALIFAAFSGVILMAVGAIWILIRVIADQSGGDRYKDVQR